MEFAISIARINKEHSKIFCITKYASRLLEIDMQTFMIKEVLRFEDEEQLADLFSDIIQYNNQMLLVPNKAKFFYVVNLQTGRQIKYEKEKILSNAFAGVTRFFVGLFQNKARVVCRDIPVTVEFDFETEKWEIVNLQYANDQVEFTCFAIDDKEMVCLDYRNNRLYIFDSQQKCKKVDLDFEIGYSFRNFIGDDYLIFDVPQEKLYRIGKEGNEKKVFNIKFSDDMVSPVAIEKNGIIYLYSNKRNEIVLVDEEQRIKTVQKTNDLYTSYIDCQNGWILGIKYNECDMNLELYYYDEENKYYDLRICNIEKFVDIMKNDKENALKTCFRNNQIEVETKILSLRRFINYVKEIG